MWREGGCEGWVGGEWHDIAYIGHLGGGLCLAVVVQDLLPVPKMNTYLHMRNSRHITCYSHHTRDTSAETRSYKLSWDDRTVNTGMTVVVLV